jgi:hypothetical protein
MADQLVPDVPGLDPGLDQDEVRALLIELDGNVTKAAIRLGVDPERLRAYVNGMAVLRRAMAETIEQGVDRAVDILFEGLRDEMSFQNRYYAAKEFLRSEAGRRRGFGRQELSPAALEVRTENRAPAVITLKWLEPPAEAS